MPKELEIQQERRSLMLDTPIPRLITKMAIPTIVAMLVSSIYSMADTYFVSYLGLSATAAVGVNMSIDQMIMMAGSFLAIGSSSYIARLLGAKNNDKASKTLSTAFFSAVFLGLCVMLPGLLFTEKIVVLLGATPASTPYAIDYARYVLIGAPFMATSFVLNQCLRSEGSPIYSMLGIGIGAVINIGLDPLFIFTFDLGIAGAAMATAISKFISFGILIFPYLRKRSLLRLSIKEISFSHDIVREILLMGLPSLLRMGLSVVALIIINNMAGNHSDAALGALSIASRIMLLPSAAILGFGHGFQPVAGYNWGAKDFGRVRAAFRFSSIAVVLGIGLVCALMGAFSTQIIQLFPTGDANLLEIGRFCIISQCIAMPLNAWVVIVNMLYSSLGRPLGAIILGMTRQGICFLPLVFILPNLFGILGLAATQAAADIFSFFIAIPFAITAIHSIKNANNQEIKLPTQD